MPCGRWVAGIGRLYFFLPEHISVTKGCSLQTLQQYHICWVCVLCHSKGTKLQGQCAKFWGKNCNFCEKRLSRKRYKTEREKRTNFGSCIENSNNFNLPKLNIFLKNLDFFKMQKNVYYRNVFAHEYLWLKIECTWTPCSRIMWHSWFHIVNE